MDTPENPTTTATIPTQTANGSTAPPAALDTIDAPQPVPLPLNVFLIGPDQPTTVTLTRGGGDAVILGRVDTASVELVRDGRIAREPDTLLAVPVTDPDRQTELLRAALSADVAARRTLAETAEQRRTELFQTRVAQANTRREIRDYLIDRYRDDEIDRDVLDAFLERFDLDEYQPRIRVTYTITGSFEVDSDSTDTVQDNVTDYLGVDLDQINDIVDDSGDYQVSVSRVESVTD